MECQIGVISGDGIGPEIVTEAKKVLDQIGNKRRENLAAARAAIQTMNEMLGVSEGDKKERKSYNITLSVKDASEDAE